MVFCNKKKMYMVFVLDVPALILDILFTNTIYTNFQHSSIQLTNLNFKQMNSKNNILGFEVLLDYKRC